MYCRMKKLRVLQVERGRKVLQGEYHTRNMEKENKEKVVQVRETDSADLEKQ